MGPPTRNIRLGDGAEFDLIRRFLAAGPPVSRADVSVGPGDDAAVVLGSGIVVSVDASVEDVHFRRAWLAPEEIGYRAAAAALSDLAAMAARPIGILATLALADADAELGPALMAGARRAADSVGAAVLGGDLTRSPGPIFLDVVVLGEAREPVLRAGALPGDELWVTGELGAAAAAVAAWRRGDEPAAGAREAFARPRPRVREARWLAGRGLPRAMLDLSDGLAGDLRHLAVASAVQVVLEPERVPVSAAALEATRDREAALRLALGGGEDYELVFAAPPGAVAPLAPAFAAETGVRLTRIGEAREGEGVVARAGDGTLRPLDIQGYRHFQDRET